MVGEWGALGGGANVVAGGLHRGGGRSATGAWVPVSAHENDGGGRTAMAAGTPALMRGGRSTREGAWVPVSTHENDGERGHGR